MWEVVYPTSRAVELGVEDVEEEKCLFKDSFTTSVVRLSNELQSEGETVSCKLLVLAFDRIPTTFIEAHFINNKSQIVGVVSSANVKERCPVSNSLRQTARSDKTCFIHSTHGSNEVLFLQCKVDVSVDSCHNWANEVLSCFKAEKVLLLSTLPSSVCSLDDDIDSDRIFALKTDSWKRSINCQFLSPPNIVSNLPAAVLTHCQIFNIPALLYIGVTTTDSTQDSSVIEIFNLLLETEPLTDLPKNSKTETAQFLKSIKIACPHLESNMYI